MRERPEYYAPDGVPCSMQEWVKAWEDPDTKIIAKTTVGDQSVSTVYLGLDHGWGDGPPLIFETMIFGGPFDQQQWRYSTREQAVEGHAHAVKVAESRIAARFGSLS